MNNNKKRGNSATRAEMHNLKKSKCKAKNGNWGNSATRAEMHNLKKSKCKAKNGN